MNTTTTTDRQYGREDVDFATWYSPHTKQLAKIHTRAELERRLGGVRSEGARAARSHLRAIEATGSMQGQSQRRAQARNSTAAAGDLAIALRGALEIYDLFPEHTKDGSPTRVVRVDGKPLALAPRARQVLAGIAQGLKAEWFDGDWRMAAFRDPVTSAIVGLANLGLIEIHRDDRVNAAYDRVSATAAGLAMVARPDPPIEPEPGKTYLCTDGVIRWVTGKGPSGAYYCCWRDEDGDVWHSGGTFCGRWRAKRRTSHPWPGGEEIEGPKPGDVVTTVGVFGATLKHVVPASDDEGSRA